MFGAKMAIGRCLNEGEGSLKDGFKMVGLYGLWTAKVVPFVGLFFVRAGDVYRRCCCVNGLGLRSRMSEYVNEISGCKRYKVANH